MALNREQKGYLFTVRELKQKAESGMLFKLSYECALGQLNFFLYSAYVGMTMKAPPTLILEL